MSLEKRYSPDPPENVSEKEMNEWVAKVQTPIRLRVFNVLKSWIIHHYYDFENDPELVKNFHQFIQDKMAPTMRSCATQLTKAMEIRVTSH